MNVLGIVSSPRRAGNSELAVKEIFRSLPADWNRRMVRLNELNIKYCTACYACVPAEKKCKIDDDFDFFLDQVRWADKVVIAAPSYFMSSHTAIKNVNDRFLSILNNHDEFKHKDCVFIAPYGRPGQAGMVKEAMTIFSRKLNLRLVDCDVVLAANPGDTVKGDNMQILRRLAASLIAPPAKPFAPEDELLCPYCYGGALTLKTDGSWTCRVCSGFGGIEFKDGKFSLTYDPDFNMYVFTPQDLHAHGVYLTEMKKMFLENKDKIKELQAGYADEDFWVRP